MKFIGHKTQAVWIGTFAMILLLCLGACGKRSLEGHGESPAPPAATPQAPVAAGVVETPPAVLEEALRMERLAQVKAALKDIHYDFDRYDLRPGECETLKANFRLLTSLEGVTLIIEGHCDERGSAEYNLALGQKRADAARAYLVNLGMDGGRIETVSFGEERPVDPGRFEAAWAMNRRAHLVVQE